MEAQYGRYGLLRRLAVGGMAEIYLAALHGDAGFEKRVVLKRILPHLGQDDDFVHMFIDEAMVASRLSHPNIIEVYDFGHNADSYFIAMEYDDGLDLHQMMQRAKALNEPLSFAEVAAIGERVARGLSYTHNLLDADGQPLGIVHRDVSPHNIMVSRLGVVKVMDFGIAKAAARASRTLTGTIKGKIAYMAPEQAKGQSATKKSDQFALGIILWECLAGRKLFAAESDVTLLQKVASCEVSDVALIRPDAPADLCAIIQRALKCDPAQRYDDLAHLADALTEARYRLGSQGISKLEALVPRYAMAVSEAQPWSWAQQQAGTRVLPHAAQPVHSGPAAQPKRWRNLTPLPRQGHGHGKRRPPVRHRQGTANRPVEAPRIERLPWLLVGALLAVLMGTVGRMPWATTLLQRSAAAAGAWLPLPHALSSTIY